MLKRFLLSHKEVVTYVFVGGTAALVEYGIFVAVHLISHSLILSQTISFLTGLIVSFVGNRQVTFSSDAGYVKGGQRQMVYYAALAAFNLLFTNIAIVVLSAHIGIVAWFAKIVIMALVVVWNFLLFKYLIFKRND